MSTLRIGVFFDGTGCNAHNYFSENPLKEAKVEGCESPDNCKCEKVQVFGTKVESETVVPGAGYMAHKSGSYKSPPTVIWYLYKNYESGYTNLGYQLGIYVSGCGTYDGQEDDTATMGAGYTIRPKLLPEGWKLPGVPRYSTGVINKTDDAVKQIGEELNKLKEEIHGLTFETIEYELFGFSRGATAARHFANRIAKKDKSLVKVVKNRLGPKIYPKIGSEPIGSINMIGLFDSVASILTIDGEGVRVSNASTGDVMIDLTDVNSKHVFHLTAAHEMRYFFSLNRTLPLAVAKELELPGAHSDIGGGYLPVCEERFFISLPSFHEEKADTKVEDTQAYAEAQKDMERLLAHPKWGPIWTQNDVDVKVVGWSTNARFLHNAVHSTRLFGAAVIMRRLNVQTGIEAVAMDAMRDYCVKSGGSLFKELGAQAPKIPDDLLPLREAVRAKLQSGGDSPQLDSVSEVLSPELARKYVHCSAFYQTIDEKLRVENTIEAGATPGMKVTLTNRPTDNLIRNEYNGLGLEFKP